MKTLLVGILIAVLIGCSSTKPIAKVEEVREDTVYVSQDSVSAYTDNFNNKFPEEVLKMVGVPDSCITDKWNGDLSCYYRVKPWTNIDSFTLVVVYYKNSFMRASAFAVY